ncbi:UDP-N-acetylenolpyruvoylglucosamine reductase [Lysobacter daejeonensis GH1-9]|uniref:UDP-N-acetylenolpyruvoylglucosamine reductase n=1 Tax=Lysobacter daejeonensis GH1-9 TaxID=1385517 RepID=A0A0A0EXU7_9GAMM|nr:UDP-N-acetylmuramate dehydrogenase [Lysobacter daejeonensis]KGM54888.1 UDP-N-acetylenolpyruvoylglucosamine reductase [Lysobacter daejeonensis GH1-9]
MTDTSRIVRDASLRERNTFGVEATAPWLVEVADAARLPEVLQRPELAAGLALVLGGGSNLLFAGDPDGAVLALTGQHVTVLEDGDTAIVRADAGVQWHNFVMHTLSMGLCGLENLALIPGTVGAAPIQNIGAYGVEVREFVHAVEAFEPATGEVHRLDAAACRFAYRDSLFKHAPDRYLVTSVEFALPRQPVLRLDYAGIAEELATMGIAQPTPTDVAEAVIAIRRRKLPDPAVLGNAGSFFKNPIVPAAQAEALKAGHDSLPMFRGGSDDTRKLSAAWLIDQCGWKGYRDGDAGVAASHALVLVNHGQATGAQLLDLARRIAASVHERFGVAIEPEPRVIGATW